jgi:hypothetical protein
MVRRTTFGAVLRGLVVVVIAVGIWYPDATHDRIDLAPAPVAVVGQSEVTPADAVLKEVGDIAFDVPLLRDPAATVAVANEVLQGHLSSSAFGSTLQVRDYPDDLLQGTSSPQLAVAGLGIERILLTAYEETGDRRYRDQALVRVLQFARYEASQRRNTTFLWNDHATSARVAVLVKLWRAIRGASDVGADQRREIVSLVERSGRRLAKPQQFTVRTNHGVMQNLALLQIVAGFPDLPEAPQWRALALQRLQTQLAFYVSDEGFVLEHSAEYHWFGTQLLAYAARLCVLAGVPPPPRLVAASAASERMLARLLRPDGSLPVFGNTNAGEGRPRPLVSPAGTEPVGFKRPPFAVPVPGVDLLPLSGYAIWWQGTTPGSESQTIVAWAKHDGHGHKHADEGSVVFWAYGVDWITNSGYWPYDAPGEAAAYSWTASNALHQVDETFTTAREAKLVAAGSDATLRFVDVERRDADGRSFRRQVLQLSPLTLLVLDFAAGATGEAEAFWTVDPSLRLKPGSVPGSFVSSTTPDGRRLAVSYAPTDAIGAVVLRASEHPFAGWVVIEGKPTPADALRLSSSGPSTVRAMIFEIGQPADPATSVTLETGATIDHWRVAIGGPQPRTVTRDETSVAVGTRVAGADRNDRLQLSPAPDTEVRARALRDAYATAIAAYPPWREVGSYRQRMLIVLGGLFALSEAAVVVLARTSVLAYRRWIFVDGATILAWAVLAWWVLERYFR